MKVLNLYSCLGGNRYKWNEVKNDIEVTAVERDEELAKLYKERFPDDEVIVDDAHQYLLDRYNDFDFIWTSPPCPTHSRARFWGFGANGKNPVYPDMKLYQEVLFLEHHFKGKYVVENVVPYYEPLLRPKRRGRHLYWTNFNLPNKLSERNFIGLCQTENEITKLLEFNDLENFDYKGKQRKDKLLRNMVDFEVGKTIFETALGVINNKTKIQTKLF